MKSKRRIVTPPVLLAILALTIHAILVPPMALGSGWAALCSPDGTNKFVPVGGAPAPGGLGDCDDCPVCPASHEIVPPDFSVVIAFAPRPGEPSPIYLRRNENAPHTAVSFIPVGRRAPPSS